MVGPPALWLQSPLLHAVMRCLLLLRGVMLDCVQPSTTGTHFSRLQPRPALSPQ